MLDLNVPSCLACSGGTGGQNKQDHLGGGLLDHCLAE